MATQDVQEVTEDQATDALHQLTSSEDVAEKETVVEAEQPTDKVETAPAEEKVEDAPKEEASEEKAEEAIVETDDVTSLKKRLEEAETSAKEREERYEARVKAIQERNAESVRILRDRHLRKSTAADKALRIIKAATTDAGVDPAEANRVIQELEGTMHPASVSYAPPEPRAAATEDQALVFNDFLNEKGMTNAEAERFGQWVRVDAPGVLTVTEQAVANESLDGFLRIAHTRWQEGVREGEKKQKVDDAVGAVKSVQRTQREAARAASAPSTSPKKQPAGPAAGTDVSKLSKDDVSALIRQATQQYK